MEHSELREKIIWKTQDGQAIILKNISDSHLTNIINYLMRKKHFRSSSFTMLNEKRYRKINNIVNSKVMRKPFKLKRKKDLGR